MSAPDPPTAPFPGGGNPAGSSPERGGDGFVVVRVSTLELFFDLVIVFTITRVTHLVAHAHGAPDLLRALLVLAVTWWMYGGYARLTSHVGAQRPGARLLLLCGMAGFLVMALGIPGVARGDGVAFGLAYLVVVVVHAALFTRAPNTPAGAIHRIAPFNVAVALFVLAAGFAPGAWNLACWSIAGLALVMMTLGRREQGFEVDVARFAERHGLIILIALVESLVGTGAGAADIPVRPPLAGVAVLALALGAGLWWCYFDRDAAAAGHAMMHAAPAGRARLAVLAYWYAHLAMIAGIVVAAAGVQGAFADLARPAAHGTAWLLAVGVAAYLAGEAAFRRLLGVGSASVRLAASGMALATAAIGLAAGSPAQLVVLVAVVVAMLVAEPHVLRPGFGRPRD